MCDVPFGGGGARVALLTGGGDLGGPMFLSGGSSSRANCAIGVANGDGVNEQCRACASSRWGGIALQGASITC